jgi:hypothetical protein
VPWIKMTDEFWDQLSTVPGIGIWCKWVLLTRTDDLAFQTCVRCTFMTWNTVKLSQRIVHKIKFLCLVGADIFPFAGLLTVESYLRSKYQLGVTLAHGYAKFRQSAIKMVPQTYTPLACCITSLMWPRVTNFIQSVDNVSSTLCCILCLCSLVL